MPDLSGSQGLLVGPMRMRRRFERVVQIRARPEIVFARLDAQTGLARASMRRSTRRGGTAFGLPLMVDEQITERTPPRRKVWHAVGSSRLAPVGGYQMGFAIRRVGTGSSLHIWSVYDPAHSALGRWLDGMLLAPYARWCVSRMARDATAHFSDGRRPAD